MLAQGDRNFVPLLQTTLGEQRIASRPGGIRTQLLTARLGFQMMNTSQSAPFAYPLLPSDNSFHGGYTLLALRNQAFSPLRGLAASPLN